MNKMYIKAPLVLGAICVCSAGLIGGLHAVASWYSETHKSSEAPEAIKVLNPNAQFTEVEGFTPLTKMGDVTKVTLESVYVMSEGGQKTGYAYTVNCGKPVKTDVTFTVAFAGDISEATVASVKPLAINVTSGGDGGYDTNTFAYAAGIVDGSKEFNDTADIVSGGTKSQKFLRDGLNVARNDYLARWNGEEPGPTPSSLPEQILKMYPKATSATKDEDFAELSFSYTNATNKKLKSTGKVTQRYRVETSDGVSAFVYNAEATSTVSEYAAEPCTINMWASFEAPVVEGGETNIPVAKTFVESNTYSYNEWETAYLPHLTDGTINLDDSAAIKTGATVSSGTIRAMLLKMRNDYYTTVLKEESAKVETYFKKIYGDKYVSYTQDEFTKIEKGAATDYKSLTVDARYSVTLSSGVAKVYLGSVSATIMTEGEETLGATLFVGFSQRGETAAATKPDGFAVKSSTFSFSQWEDAYLPGIVDGSKSLESDTDVKCSATYSAKAVRKFVVEMRNDFFGLSA